MRGSVVKQATDGVSVEQERHSSRFNRGMGRARWVHALAAIFVLLLAASALPASKARAETSSTQRYLVVFAGTQEADGTFALGGNYDLNHQAAVSLVESAGGTITSDLSRQIGVMLVESASSLFAGTLETSTLVESVAEDFAWKQFPSLQEALDSGQLTLVSAEDAPGGAEETADPLEPLQWSMRLIRAPEAHALQAGARAVDVGILDSGVDGRHQDFVADLAGTNVDCARGRDFVPAGPGVGNPDPCIDNQFHGTHVAGIVAAQANGLGVVGVAPNVTLVPVKVCDTAGYCYASSAVAGITYAGDAKLDVINMSFFVDDDTLLASTEFKCSDDPVQRTFRRAVERAIQYAREQGVTPVAALGNSDNDLAQPPEPYENNCDVVPAETQGVIGTMSLGPGSEKASYSNYGSGMTDVAAPGGNGSSPYGEFPGPCGTQVLSTIPGGWGCLQGTSMASPHAAGVAALIVSQFGRFGTDSGEPDVVMRPTEVENYLQSTTIDIGLEGYDECFGNGRIDAFRAVQHDTDNVYQSTLPCPEYAE